MTQLLKHKAQTIHDKLLAFYGKPIWRNPLPALDELVCTILSQNTNDVNRDRAFDALVDQFPTWESVRDGDSDAVMDAIRPAGLANQKGPRIQAVLQAITEERGELSLEFLKGMPSEEVMTWLVRFKGVGPKTAAIVMLFSLDLPGFPVDTHVHRITGRLGLRPEKMSAEKAHFYFPTIFEEETFYDVHLNIIRLGREICKARKPQCESCPLQDDCDHWASLS